MELNLETILLAHKAFNTGVKSGNVYDFFKEMTVEFLDDEILPIYLVVHHFQGKRVVIGGNLARNGKPTIRIGEKLDLFFRPSSENEQ